MGCPFNSKLVFGISLSKDKAKVIQKELDVLDKEYENHGDYERFQKEVGEFETYISSNDRGKFYLEVTDLGDVDNCGYLIEIYFSEMEASKIEADRIYDDSPFLKKHFKKEDITLLLIANYIG